MNRHDDFVEYMDAARARNEPREGPIELWERRKVTTGIRLRAEEAVDEINIQARRKSEGLLADKEAVKREAANLARRAYGAWAWAERNL